MFSFWSTWRLRPSARRRWRVAAAGALLTLMFTAAVWLFWPHQPGLVTRPSVAVPPFNNVGG